MIKRIAKIIDNEGLSKSSFERRISASNGVISSAIKNNTNIENRWIANIIREFPQYNAQWIVAGVGEMLLEDEYENKFKTMSEPAESYEVKSSKEERWFNLIESQQETIKNQSRAINNLTEKNNMNNGTADAM